MNLRGASLTRVARRRLGKGKVALLGALGDDPEADQYRHADQDDDDNDDEDKEEMTMKMHRALLTSEGLLDLLVGSAEQQTGRCLSLQQHTF